MKKTTKTLIIGIVSVAVLGGAFALVYKFLPQQEDPKDIANINSVEQTSSADYTAEEDVPAEYALIQHIPAEIRKIEVTNETGSYTLLADTPTAKVENEDGTTSTVTETTIYTLVGYEDKDLLTGYPDMLANDSAALVAGKKVNDGSDKGDFGFDSPRATVTVTYSSGESATIIVGDDAPDNKGAYVMVEGDENVYLAASDSVDGFLLGAMGMISTEIGSAASDDSGNVFSKMVMGGTLFGGDVVFEYANSENFSETYRITSPDNVLANEEVVTYMLNNVRNLKAKEVAAVNVPDDKLADYDLDEPYATVQAEYPDLKVDYKASKPDGEGNFYLLSSGIVYKMSTDSVPWVLHDYNDCVVKSILRPKYGSVTGVSIEADGKTYDFDIKTTEEKDGDVTNTTTTVTCGGAAVDSDKFNTFMQNLESAERAGGIEKSADSGKSVLKITLKFADGETTTAEFYEAANRKCPVIVNGSLASFAYETYVTKMIADTPLIAANGSVDSVY